MNIVLNQKAFAVIIKPDNATGREEFAALELQKYLAKMSGVVVPITTDSEETTGNAILIGGPERNRTTAACMSESDFDCSVLGPDGVMIKTIGEDKLVLAGSSKNPNERERGTIYAVYEFLERFLGCSFSAYGKLGMELGEYIPYMTTIWLDEIRYVKPAADLPYRTAIVQFDGMPDGRVNSDANHSLTMSFIDWMAKNRLNRMLLMMNSYEIIKKNGILSEIIKRGISLTVGHHDSSMFFLPPEGNCSFKERYYETYPEYYSLLPDGTRFFTRSKWIGQVIFDTRNSNCIRQVANNMKKWLKENSYVDIINLWPNDTKEPKCACSECSKYSLSTNYVHFVNEVAKLVNEDFPDVKLDMIVYLNLWNPPESIEIHPGVLVEVSTWGPHPDGIRDLLRSFGKRDGTGLIGTGVERNAIVWSSICKGLVYYDYYMTSFGCKQVYCPMADEIIKIYESFIEKGYCLGTGSQMEPYNLWNYLFNFYTHGRKSFDTSLTMEDLLDRFVRIFGKGGEFIKDYLMYIEDFYEGQVPEGKDGYESAPWFAANVDSQKVYRIFEKAYEVEQEGICRDNIRMLRMAFRYSDLHTNHPESEELVYMSNEFGSYWGTLGQTGYGIAVYEKSGESNYTPDKWYKMSGNI